MRMTSASFDGDENPTEFAVVMSLDEMALLYRLSAHIAPKTVTEAFSNIRWGEALDDLATGAGSILNRFYEDGPNDVIPKPRAPVVGFASDQP